jgi:dihydroorotate dehydrogenase
VSRLITSGGFSSMGGKFLMVMTGAAAVGVGTKLLR